MNEFALEQTGRVLDSKKINATINGIIDVLEQRQCTAAEAIKAVNAVNASLKKNYPRAYEILAR